MKSNKKTNLPWEKETKHVSPRTLLITGLAVICLIGITATVFNLGHTGNDASSSTIDVKDFTRDPSYQGNAMKNGGANQPETQQDTSEEGFGTLVAIPECLGTTPTLEQLQKHEVFCVYDSDGNRYDLFSDDPKLERIADADAELPAGDLYVDSIGSGRYFARTAENGRCDIYIFFNDGHVYRTQYGVGVYDTVIITEDGKAVNTVNEPINHGVIDESVGD